MKKFFSIFVCVMAIVGFVVIGILISRFTNQALFDTTYRFDRAVITMPDSPNGYVTGKVDSWMEYDNSDVVQVTIDGVTYLTHYFNVVLIAE